MEMQSRGMTTVTAKQLHERTAELIERVMRTPEKPIFVRRNGQPAVILVDARYFEALLETLNLLIDPQAAKMLYRGLEDERAGRLIPHDQLMKELCLVE